MVASTPAKDAEVTVPTGDAPDSEPSEPVLISLIWKSSVSPPNAPICNATGDEPFNRLLLLCVVVLTTRLISDLSCSTSSFIAARSVAVLVSLEACKRQFAHAL